MIEQCFFNIADKDVFNKEENAAIRIKNWEIFDVDNFLRGYERG